MIKINGKWKHTEDELKKMKKWNSGKKMSLVSREKMKLKWKENHDKRVADMKQYYIKYPERKIKIKIFMLSDKNPMRRKDVKEKHLIAVNTPEHKKLRSEIFKKVSERPEIKILFLGRNNPNWRGGIQYLPYSIKFNKELKKQILKRDNYKCILCLSSGQHIHHIDYDKLNCEENNLVTLCRSCHCKTNYNREFWKTFFQSNSIGMKDLTDFREVSIAKNLNLQTNTEK